MIRRIFLYSVSATLGVVATRLTDYSARLTDNKRTYAFPFLVTKLLLMKLKYLFSILAIIFAFTGTNAIAQKVSAGDATYYGRQFHGRRTSDGSKYHRDSLTCAHRTLPFGTLLKVRNTKNGREVVVKVTDRGPFRRGGIVDLSFAAAKEIDMVNSGVVRVEIEAMGQEPSFAVVNDKQHHLPELQLLDPSDGNYYTMSEWVKRGQAARERAKLQAAQRNRASYLAKNKQQPRWRILNGKMTAKAGKK